MHAAAGRRKGGDTQGRRGLLRTSGGGGSAPYLRRGGWGSVAPGRAAVRGTAHCRRLSVLGPAVAAWGQGLLFCKEHPLKRVFSGRALTKVCLVGRASTSTVVTGLDFLGKSISLIKWMDPKIVKNRTKIYPVYLFSFPQDSRPTAFSSTDYRPGPHSLKSSLVLGFTAQALLAVSLNEKFNFSGNHRSGVSSSFCGQ